MGWVENPASLWGLSSIISHRADDVVLTRARDGHRGVCHRGCGAAWYPLAQTARDTLPGSLLGSEGGSSC